MRVPLEERRSILMLEGNARASGGECIPIIEEPNSLEYVEDIEDTPVTMSHSDVGTTYNVELPDTMWNS